MTATRPRQTPWILTGPGLVFIVTLANLLQHLLTAARYGPEPDELYFMLASKHMAWGFEDMPPGIAAIQWLLRHIVTPTYANMQVLAAFISAGMTWLTGAIARELGGRRWVQCVAALTTAFAPLMDIWSHVLTMNLIEQVLWTAIAWCTVRAIARQDGRMWIVIGALIGLGFETKYTIGLLCLGLVAGMLFSAERRWLRSWQFWTGLAIAFVIAVPDFLWQRTHGYTFLHHMRDLRLNTGASHSLLAHFVIQVFVLNALTFPLWVGGMVWCFTRRGYRARLIGFIFVFGVGILMAGKGRGYYMLPAFPMIFAAGAVAWQQWLDGAGRRGAQLRWAWVACFILSSIVFAPIMLPVLNRQGYEHYEDRLSGMFPSAVRSPAISKIPRYFQDEFAWEELAQEMSAAYHALPPNQQQETAIWAQNYGEAAALAYYAPQYQLPQPISGDVAFWYWGPAGYSGDSVLLAGSSVEQARTRWNHVQVVGHHDGMLSTEHYDILLCTGAKQPMSVMWPQMQLW